MREGSYSDKSLPGRVRVRVRFGLKLEIKLGIKLGFGLGLGQIFTWLDEYGVVAPLHCHAFGNSGRVKGSNKGASKIDSPLLFSSSRCVVRQALILQHTIPLSPASQLFQEGPVCFADSIMRRSGQHVMFIANEVPVADLFEIFHVHAPCLLQKAIEKHYIFKLPILRISHLEKHVHPKLQQSIGVYYHYIELIVP